MHRKRTAAAASLSYGQTGNGLFVYCYVVSAFCFHFNLGYGITQSIVLELAVLVARGSKH